MSVIFRLKFFVLLASLSFIVACSTSSNIANTSKQESVNSESLNSVSIIVVNSNNISKLTDVEIESAVKNRNLNKYFKDSEIVVTRSADFTFDKVCLKDNDCYYQKLFVTNFSDLNKFLLQEIVFSTNGKLYHYGVKISFYSFDRYKVKEFNDVINIPIASNSFYSFNSLSKIDYQILNKTKNQILLMYIDEVK